MNIAHQMILAIAGVDAFVTSFAAKLARTRVNCEVSQYRLCTESVETLVTRFRSEPSLSHC